MIASASRWQAAAFLCGNFIFACDVDAAFRIEEVADGVFVHVGNTVALDAPGHDDIANIGFIVGDRCVAVIDTGGSVRTGRALRAAIRERTTLPICYVINTHVHVDHVLGDIAFKSDRPHFVGSSMLPSSIARSRDFFVANYALDLGPPGSPDQIVVPDETVATTRDIDLGNRKLTLRAWPKAHTDCDLTVYDERTGTLWTGDLLFVGRVPALDGSLKGWLAATDQLATMHPRHVVPGHGNVGSDIAVMLAPERHYLQTLLDETRAAITSGQTIDVATRTVGIGEKSHWLLFDTANPRNVSRAYQELEWE